MAQINEEIILKRYESLPDDLKEALMGVNTADAIYEIGRKANLNVEKIGALAEEVGLIILGFTPSANFISDLKTALGVNEEKAAEIAGEVNERVFLPIRESLKRLHGAAWGEGLTRPPVKFEGQKVAEVKPAAPVPEIKPAPAAPPPPREPMIIRPMGVAGAPPKEEVKGVTEIPRPVPPTPPQPIAPKPAPPPAAARPPLPSPLTAAPKPAPSPPPPIPPRVPPAKPPEIKVPLAPPIKIKAEPKPAAPPTPPPIRQPGFDPYKEPIE